MSYDVSFMIDTGSSEQVGWRNYTSNVSGMWAKALDLPPKPWIGHDGRQVVGYRVVNGELVREPLLNRGLTLLDNCPASEAAGALADAVKRMETNPDEYTPLNPKNGWGDYEGALEFLRWIADMASKHPRCTIHVSA